MASLDEQETVIVINRGEEVVRIWSNVASHVRKMHKGDQYTHVSGDEEAGATFTVPASEYRPLVTKNRRVMTEEQRQALSDRARANFSKHETP